MDRVQVLIEKLSTQKVANESPVQLLITVQLLHEELLRQHQEPYVGTSKKVSVVLPAIVANVIEDRQSPVVVNEVVEKKKATAAVPVAEPKEEKPMFHQPSFFDVEEASPVINEVISESDKETYTLRKPSFPSPEPVTEEIKPQTQPLPQQNSALPFDVMEEIPTFSQRQTQREVHEVIGSKEASLNDKLKQEKTELANVLKDAPIKDLRKGIGVNDKFLFINELFRGDENLYEKSIKTINAFHILPEAEYWINRELKVKLGWNDDKEVVQHFYQLVKRRFS